MSSKLDRLVAERVMGWRVHVRNTAWWVDADVENGLIVSGGVRGLTCGTDRWSPSTSISAAWNVKRAMYAKGFRLSLSEPFVSLIVSFKKGNDQGKPCGGSEQAQNEDKEPLAICLAALRACGVPEAEIREAMTP